MAGPRPRPDFSHVTLFAGADDANGKEPRDEALPACAHPRESQHGPMVDPGAPGPEAHPDTVSPRSRLWTTSPSRQWRWPEPPSKILRLSGRAFLIDRFT